MAFHPIDLKIHATRVKKEVAKILFKAKAMKEFSFEITVNDEKVNQKTIFLWMGFKEDPLSGGVLLIVDL